MDDKKFINTDSPQREAGSALAPSGDASSNSPEFEFTVSSNVKEVIGTLPQEKQPSAGGSSGQQSVTKTPQEKKAELLARLPKDQDRAEKYMRRQVMTTLEEEIATLESKLSRPENYHEMNIIMAKIRQFRDILSELAHITFEKLKTLWLQFVHQLSV